jgi:GT2 family glycosyltransferase
MVIPTWNGRHLLERFLPSVVTAADSYRRESGGDVEILVVDDGSTDGTDRWIAEASSAAAIPIRFTRLAANGGFARAANRGVGDASHPLVWLLNNDVEVPPDAVDALVRPFAESDARLFAVHSQMIDLETGRRVGTGKTGSFSRGFLRVHRSFLPAPDSTGPYWSMFATGGSAMYRRDVFVELGGFDETFAPFYLEDVELSYRAWKRGWRVRYQPASVVAHQFSSTIGTLGAPVEWISQRNRLLFHWIHLHDRRFLLAHLCWVALLLASAPVTGKWNFLGGFADALRDWPRVRAKRLAARRQATCSDRDILRVFEDMIAHGTVRPYDTKEEVGL